MVRLNNKIDPSVKQPKSNTPFIFTLLKKCKEYNISYDLMSRLNYNDLQYLIIEHDIDYFRTRLKELEYRRQEKQGIEVAEATNEQILAMHSK